jgi:hypothetical protein
MNEDATIKKLESLGDEEFNKLRILINLEAWRRIRTDGKRIQSLKGLIEEKKD